MEFSIKTILIKNGSAFHAVKTGKFVLARSIMIFFSADAFRDAHLISGVCPIGISY